MQIENFGLQQDRLLQLVEIGLLLGRYFHREHVAAQVFGHQFVAEQLLADLLHVGTGLIDLVDGDDVGTFAALAWRIASTVCGMMPSSAATTSTTKSVTLAPRARMAVNARGRAYR